MSSITKLPSGQWRVKVRRQGHALHRTFRLKADADAWARDQEGRIDKGETPMGALPASRETFADLIELRFADLAEVGRAFGHSKEATLLRLKDTSLNTLPPCMALPCQPSKSVSPASPSTGRA